MGFDTQIRIEKKETSLGLLLHLPCNPHNYAEKKHAHLCTHITSKKIELEGPGCSGFQFPTKPDQPGHSSSIC